MSSAQPAPRRLNPARPAFCVTRRVTRTPPTLNLKATCSPRPRRALPRSRVAPRREGARGHAGGGGSTLCQRGGDCGCCSCCLGGGGWRGMGSRLRRWASSCCLRSCLSLLCRRAASPRSLRSATSPGLASHGSSRYPGPTRAVRSARRVVPDGQEENGGGRGRAGQTGGEEGGGLDRDRRVDEGGAAARVPAW
jgi:hypothetical protein